MDNSYSQLLASITSQNYLEVATSVTFMKWKLLQRHMKIENALSRARLLPKPGQRTFTRLQRKKIQIHSKGFRSDPKFNGFFPGPRLIPPPSLVRIDLALFA